MKLQEQLELLENIRFSDEFADAIENLTLAARTLIGMNDLLKAEAIIVIAKQILHEYIENSD